MSFFVRTLLMVFGLMWLELCSAKAAEPTKPKRAIINAPAKIIETGLVPCCGEAGLPLIHVGEWLSNDILLLNALRNIPNADKQREERLVTFDLKSRKVTTLFENNRMQCSRQELNIYSIGSKYNWESYRFVKIDEYGKLSEINIEQNIEKKYCTEYGYHDCISGVSGFKGGGIRLTRFDGLIPIIMPGESILDFERKAVLLRPAMPPLTLPIFREEVADSWAIYHAFSDQYQLNWHDSQASSSTNRRTGGQSWKRPYDLSPYYLLSRDGTVETIPYPNILKEFDVRHFSRLLMTRAGLLIDATGDGPKSMGERGLFLLRENQLTQVWGFPNRAGIKEGMVGESLSPDGCKIAFTRFMGWGIGTFRNVVILNLCEGE
jgi:hypothetical protein